MKAVLKIAHRAFLFPSAKKAAEALSMLSDAMEMESKHVKIGQGTSWRYIETFFPDSRPSSLSMEIVNDEQLRAIEPTIDQEDQEVPGTNQSLVIVRKARHQPRRLMITGGTQ